MRAQLEDIAAELGLALAAGAFDRLLELVKLWRAYAPAINLVGAHDEASMIAHVADGLATVACAAKLSALDEATTWLDVGSGAGLPGLVVAATTACRLALAEPRHRRAAFLELGLATIGRKGPVIRSRIDEKTWTEIAAKQEIVADISPIRITSARAVMALERWLELGEKLVISGGVVIAHGRPELDSEASRRAQATVTLARSKILGYRTPLGDRST